MARSVVELFDEASQLDEPDRATLAGLLLESLEQEPNPDVEGAWKLEIARRIEGLDSGLCSLGPLGRGEGEAAPCTERRILIARFHADAEAEALEARAWYAERSEIAARAFATEIAWATGNLLMHRRGWKQALPLWHAAVHPAELSVQYRLSSASRCQTRMNTEMHRITVGGLSVEVVRKDIKNLHLGVYPPHGRVRVAAPLVVSDDAVRLAVIGKLGWIEKQKAKFEAQPRQ